MAPKKAGEDGWSVIVTCDADASTDMMEGKPAPISEMSKAAHSEGEGCRTSTEFEDSMPFDIPYPLIHFPTA